MRPRLFGSLIGASIAAFSLAPQTVGASMLENQLISAAETGDPDKVKALLKEGKHLYLVDFTNVGGLVTPLVLEIQLASGKKTIERIPAEVWRYSPKKITKLIVTDEPMTGLVQDPHWETADINVDNNAWPRKLNPSRLELFKTNRSQPDLMKDFNTPLKKADAPADKKAAQ